MKKYLTGLLSCLAVTLSAAGMLDCPLNESIKIDGVVSKGEWDTAWKSDKFHLFSHTDMRKKPIVEPVVLAGNPTSVRMAMSPDCLYILFESRLKEGYQWKKNAAVKTEKDVHNVDTVEVFIRPNRSLDFYQFAVSIAGNRFDANGTISRLGTRIHTHEWNNTAWKSAVTYTKNSYTVEMAIPWSIFQIEPRNFYVNFTRSAVSYGENQSYLPLRGRAWAQPQNFVRMNLNMPLIRPVYVDNNVLPDPVMGNNSFAPFFINATAKDQPASVCIEVNGKKVVKEFVVPAEKRIQVPIVYPISSNSGKRVFSYSHGGRVLYQGEAERFNLSGTFVLQHPVQRSDRQVTGVFTLPFEKNTLKNSTVYFTIKADGGKTISRQMKYSEVLNMGMFAPGRYQAGLELRDGAKQVLFKKEFSFNVIPAPVW